MLVWILKGVVEVAVSIGGFSLRIVSPSLPPAALCCGPSDLTFTPWTRPFIRKVCWGNVSWRTWNTSTSSLYGPSLVSLTPSGGSILIHSDHLQLYILILGTRTEQRHWRDVPIRHMTFGVDLHHITQPVETQNQTFREVKHTLERPQPVGEPVVTPNVCTVKRGLLTVSMGVVSSPQAKNSRKITTTAWVTLALPRPGCGQEIITNMNNSPEDICILRHWSTVASNYTICQQLWHFWHEEKEIDFWQTLHIFKHYKMILWSTEETILMLMWK